MTDKEYDELPDEIKEILESWDDSKSLHKECERIKKELESIGWTCEHSLCGIINSVYEIQ